MMTTTKATTKMQPATGWTDTHSGEPMQMGWRTAKAAREEIVRLRSALSELTALVRGECGALLDEDRGGSASLSMEIDDLLRPNVQAEGAAQDLSRSSPGMIGSACCESRLLKGNEVIKYRTSFNKIEALEVERETDKQVVLPANNGFRSSRENKVSDWSNWHDTWEAAHAFLVAKAERDVSSLRMRLEQAKGKLGQIKAMRSNG